jgi:nitrate/TMAO reductase-like tetraheme cytochrome c subunit
MKTFDHDKTNFKLIGKHALLACKQCHKTSLTAPIKHDHCTSCHADYHNKEFAKNGISPDCNQCHTNDGFTPSLYTVEKHNLTKFRLEGAHQATPCMACHQKQGKWTFGNMGINCIDCHRNIHKGFIPDRFMGNNNCTACHNVTGWKNVTFDHTKTHFKLEGAHAKVLCSDCHFKKNEKGIKTQQFKGLLADCASCHKNNHMGQFDVNGKTECTRCHNTENWEKTKYDHNTSRFKLEGAHKQVSCKECHKEVTDDKGKYIQYTFKSIECAVCHS